MAKPTQRKDGRWIVPYYETVDGVRLRRQRYFGRGQQGEQAARAFAEQEEARFNLYDGSASPSLNSLLLAWLRARRPHKSTAQSVSRYVTDFCAPFANKPVDLLNRADLETMRAAMSTAARQPQTINKAQAYIRSMLQWAVDDPSIALDVNRWASYKRLPEPKSGSGEWSYTAEDFQALFQAAPPWLRWAMLVAFFLAIRPGHVELFGLRWTAFDWERRMARVRQGKSRKMKAVAISPRFLPLARMRYESDRAQGFEWVCHRGDGKKVKDYRTAWKWTKKRAGLEDSRIRFYDLRHFVVSLYLANKADLVTVAAQLGHATPYVTAAMYAHMLTDSQAEAAGALPDVLGINHESLSDNTTDNSFLLSDNSSSVRILDI